MNSLPRDLILAMSEYFSTVSYISFRLVSKRFRAILPSESECMKGLDLMTNNKHTKRLLFELIFRGLKSRVKVTGIEPSEAMILYIHFLKTFKGFESDRFNIIAPQEKLFYIRAMKDRIRDFADSTVFVHVPEDIIRVTTDSGIISLTVTIVPDENGDINKCSIDDIILQPHKCVLKCHNQVRSFMSADKTRTLITTMDSARKLERGLKTYPALGFRDFEEKKLLGAHPRIAYFGSHDVHFAGKMDAVYFPKKDADLVKHRFHNLLMLIKFNENLKIFAK